MLLVESYRDGRIIMNHSQVNPSAILHDFCTSLKVPKLFSKTLVLALKSSYILCLSGNMALSLEERLTEYMYWLLVANSFSSALILNSKAE